MVSGIVQVDGVNEKSFNEAILFGVLEFCRNVDILPAPTRIPRGRPRRPLEQGWWAQPDLMLSKV